MGFGPKLTSRTIRGTEYRLSLIPLGGYVAFKDSNSPEKSPGITFEEASLWARIFVVLAGPVANFMLAFVLFFGVFWHHGLQVLDPVVGGVLPTSPAEKADIQVGDTIAKIGNVKISYWEDVIKEISATEGRPFQMTLVRNGKELILDVTPKRLMQKTLLGESKPGGFVGINPQGPWKTVHLTVIEAATQGASLTWETTVETVRAFYKLIMGELPSESIGGPIMISQTISDHAEKGLSTLLILIAVISVNLAVVNLLPLPVLDGGHVLMFIIEAIRGRPTSESIQKNFQRIGLAIILLLLILGTYNDIMRL